MLQKFVTLYSIASKNERKSNFSLNLYCQHGTDSPANTSNRIKLMVSDIVTDFFGSELTGRLPLSNLSTHF